MTDDRALMRVLNGETTTRSPIWLMRQAGRFLPEYRATRASAGSFLELCYDPELAAEVTLQPIRRFGFDAAILFADILLVPQGLGRRLWFETGEGPRFEPLTDAEAVKALADDEAMMAVLASVMETVRLLRAQLPRETPLIGFAGSPWTVATYMIAGRGKDEQAGAKALMRDAPAMFDALINRLVGATATYLTAQIDAGADVVKLFDSWAGALAADEAGFERAVLRPTREIVARLRATHPQTPIILFPRGASKAQMARLLAETGVACMALGQGTDRRWAVETLQSRAAVQGDLDPGLLVEGGAAMERGAQAVLEAYAGGPHIFNLGHGVTPQVDPRHVEALVRLVKG